MSEQKQNCTVLRYGAAPCSRCFEWTPEDIHTSEGEAGTLAIYCERCCPECGAKDRGGIGG